MSYFDKLNEYCTQLEDFINHTNNCIKKINLNKCPENKISNFINENNINNYNNNINTLLSIYNRIPVYNNEITKNCNLNLLNCLGKSISFFLYLINIYNTKKPNKDNIIYCNSVLENILENFSNNKGYEKSFIFIIKNVKFYFIEQDSNLKELKQVCQFFDTIDEFFKQLNNKSNNLSLKKENVEKFLTFREKFDKTKNSLYEKFNIMEEIDEKEKKLMYENRVKTRLKQLNQQLSKRNKKILKSQDFKKSKSADVVYKKPSYPLFDDNLDEEKFREISLKHLKLNEYTEPPALPFFEQELFEMEVKCIEEFNKELKKHKSLGEYL